MRSSFVIAAALAAAVAGTDAPRQRLRKPKDAGKKLLWPLMTMGGPNNQYLQLLESMLLAEALGRALVAAPFLKWLNARGRDVRAFNETFDAAAVGRFVAVARVADLPRAHALGAVVVHAGRGSAVKQRDLATVCAMARARCAKKPFARPLVDDSSKRRCAKVPKPDGSYAACVAERYAHHDVVAASLWGSIPSLYGAIAAPRTLRAVAALRRAPRVRAAAARLRRALFGTERYVCAHLRRVEDDQRCKDGGKASFPRVACFPGTRGYASTASIAGAIRAVAAAARAPAVYVARAAPRKKSWPFAREGAALRAALNGTGAYASLDDLGDVGDDYDASLVEQELCAGAAAFVGTADSSWTGLVAQERFAAGRCGTAFEHLLRTKTPRRRGARPADLVAGALLAPSLAALDCA